MLDGAVSRFVIFFLSHADMLAWVEGMYVRGHKFAINVRSPTYSCVQGGVR